MYGEGAYHHLDTGPAMDVGFTPMPDIIDKKIEVAFIPVCAGSAWINDGATKNLTENIVRQKPSQPAFSLRQNEWRTKQRVPSRAIGEVMRSCNQRSRSVSGSRHIFQEHGDPNFAQAITMPLMGVRRDAYRRPRVWSPRHFLNVVSSQLNAIAHQSIQQTFGKRICQNLLSHLVKCRTFSISVKHKMSWRGENRGSCSAFIPSFCMRRGGSFIKITPEPFFNLNTGGFHLRLREEILADKKTISFQRQSGLINIGQNMPHFGANDHSC